MSRKHSFYIVTAMQYAIGDVIIISDLFIAGT